MRRSTAVGAALTATMFAVTASAQAMNGGTLASSPGASVAVNPGCNGVAIGKRWVVTSAFCLEGSTSTSIKIRAGNLNWSLAPETPTCDTAYEDGLGLIQVTEDLPVTPARLAGSDPKPGDLITFVGWGSTNARDPAELLRIGMGQTVATDGWDDGLGGRAWRARMTNGTLRDGDWGSAGYANGALAGVVYEYDKGPFGEDAAMVSVAAHLAFIKKTTGITRSSTKKEITSCPGTPAPGPVS